MAATNISTLSFPEKVFHVLKHCEENGRTDVISWVNNGTGFKVNDLQTFERDFLPAYFNTKKYSSFTRTLCAYGFTGVRTGRQTGIYSHPDFKPDDPVAPSTIKRIKKNRSRAKKATGAADAVMSSVSSSLFGRATRGGGDDAGSATAFGGIFQSVASRVADRASYMLVRLPPGSEYLGTFQSDSGSSPPGSEFVGTSESDSSTSPEYTHGLGTTPMTSIKQEKGSNADEDVDIEPIPVVYNNKKSSDDPSQTEDVLEPRTVEEMMDAPHNDLSLFYKFMPIVPTPKMQAQIEYSSPLSMLYFAYYFDSSAIGVGWVWFFTVGHTLQAMLTAYGENSDSFTWIPAIGIVPHHFMDNLWMHTHFAGLVLLPSWFGSGSMSMFNIYIWTQCINLSMGLKTNYYNTEKKKGTWNEGKFWVSQIVHWIMVGFISSFIVIHIGESYDIPDLKVIGIFAMNATVLWAWYSYHLLLDFHTEQINEMVGQYEAIDTGAKKVN